MGSRLCATTVSCPAIVDRTTSVCCPVSCNVVYSTNLLIGKINATKPAMRVLPGTSGRWIYILEMRISPPSGILLLFQNEDPRLGYLLPTAIAVASPRCHLR